MSPKQRRKNELKSSLDTDNLKRIREEDFDYEPVVEKEKEKKFVVDKDNTAKYI